MVLENVLMHHACACRRYSPTTKLIILFGSNVDEGGPPLWSSGQSFWLQIQRSRVRSPALPDFLSSSGSGMGSTQPREVN